VRITPLAGVAVMLLVVRLVPLQERPPAAHVPATSSPTSRAVSPIQAAQYAVMREWLARSNSASWPG
jgi:hypothetical protein